MHWLSLPLGSSLVAQQAAPLLEQLDPPRRAAVGMALLGLALLGILMVACAMIGGRWVRHLARSQPSPRKFRANSDKTRGEPGCVEEFGTAEGETIIASADSSETKAE